MLEIMCFLLGIGIMFPDKTQAQFTEIQALMPVIVLAIFFICYAIYASLCSLGE
jgi:hypothetical protein